jgi:hypothetical protein
MESARSKRVEAVVVVLADDSPIVKSKKDAEVRSHSPLTRQYRPAMRRETLS